MNRRNWMIGLAILTALTLVGQYIMLGNVGIGQNKILPGWFWTAEQALWGVRALVEVGVVIYIGMTTAKTSAEERILWSFKVILIGLIVATVGPVWAAFTLQETIISILSRPGVIVWGLTLAGISATMLAGVSYAYKIQPFDFGLIVHSEDEYQLIEAELSQSKTNAKIIADLKSKLQEQTIKVEHLQLERKGFSGAIEFLRLLPKTSAVQLLARLSDSQLDPNDVAEATGLAVTTVRSTLSRVNKNAE